MQLFNFESSLAKALTLPKSRVITSDSELSASYIFSHSLLLQRNQHLVITKDFSSAQKFIEHFQFLRAGNPTPFKTQLLPCHDTSPYSGLYTSRAAMLQRLSWFYSASFCSEPTIFVAPIKSLAQKTLPTELFLEQIAEFRKGDVLPDNLANFLAEKGYQSVPVVEDQGTYSLRGGIIDIYSPAHTLPVRVELFGDVIESLRSFQPQTQSSIGEVSSLVVAPAHEILFSEEDILRCCQKLDSCKSESDLTTIKSQVRNQTYFDGIEFLLPYFYPTLSAPIDYLPKNITTWFLDSSATDAQLTNELNSLNEEFVQYETHIPQPSALYLSREGLGLDQLIPCVYFEALDLMEASPLPSFEFPIKILPPAKTTTYSEKTELLIKKIKELKKLRAKVFICGSSEAQFQRLFPAFRAEALQLKWLEVTSDFSLLCDEQTATPSQVHFLRGHFDTSVHLLSEATVFIGYEHFFKKTEGKSSHLKTEMNKAAALSFSELREGDPVVHTQHGVALYQGLRVMNIGGIEAEFLELKFKDNDKLFLPIYRLNQVHKYSGAGTTYILDKLGGKQWEKTKAKVQTRLREVANELVQLYAKRKTIKRPPYEVQRQDLVDFEAAFPYEETPDQLQAMEDLRKDFSQEQPLDRLICGDVGFGKTEIAMRAAFLVASQKRQVAVLAPTTILTFQHYETFKKRFAHWPLKIAVLNRFVSASDTQKIIAEVREGQIDILIGTHRLLSSDVQFKELGLLIIDEEQKFGVKHKEKIRLFKNSVDTIALSATPIPRTLNMSLLGLRDLSLINTPPHDRLPTRTFVSKFDMAVIKKSVQAELKRGGQIFFLHNRVQSIYALADELREALPNAKMAVAHGQMNEHELEKTIVSFFNKEIDMLICTTIIESGMDIPNANTMFVDHANNLGLSQLYQLRGRVGRGKQRAFCYLLIPRAGNIDDVAKERLRILQQNSALGSGIQIAQYDLELRGAGTLLGEEQSGAIDAIGYEMYMDLLEAAIHEAKGQPLDSTVEPEINLKIKALIPHSYMPDIRLRLSYYKVLSNIQTLEEIDQIENDLRDQFGAPPEEVFNLMGLMMIRHICKFLGVRDVSSGVNTMSLIFTEQTRLPTQKVIELTSQANKKYSVTPDNRLKIRMNNITWQNIFEELCYLQKLCP